MRRNRQAYSTSIIADLDFSETSGNDDSHADLLGGAPLSPIPASASTAGAVAVNTVVPVESPSSPPAKSPHSMNHPKFRMTQESDDEEDRYFVSAPKLVSPDNSSMPKTKNGFSQVMTTDDVYSDEFNDDDDDDEYGGMTKPSSRRERFEKCLPKCPVFCHNRIGKCLIWFCLLALLASGGWFVWTQQLKLGGEEISEEVNPMGGAKAFDQLDQQVNPATGPGEVGSTLDVVNQNETPKVEKIVPVAPKKNKSIRHKNKGKAKGKPKGKGKIRNKGKGKAKMRNKGKISMPDPEPAATKPDTIAPAAAAEEDDDDDDDTPAATTNSLLGSYSCFTSLTDLRGAVDLYLYAANRNDTTIDFAGGTMGATYGPNIQDWCFEATLTDMSFLFDSNRNQYAARFNEDITKWDVSNVQRMDGMFMDARAFNQPIGKTWDVSRVKNMSYLFHGAASFNQALDTWDTSNVESMAATFKEAVEFNQLLNTWNMSKVETTYAMFASATAFNQPLDFWDVSRVQNMARMFASTQAFNQPINSWNVSSVTTFMDMFNLATAFNQPLDQWTLDSITTVERMFYHADAFNQDLCMWGPILNQRRITSKIRVTVTKMTTRSGCANTHQPNPAIQPTSPLCHTCT